MNEYAKIFGLEDLTLNNNKDNTESTKKRELYEVIYSVAGALGLWAGIETVIYFLQLLKIIELPEDDQREKK